MGKQQYITKKLKHELDELIELGELGEQSELGELGELDNSKPQTLKKNLYTKHYILP